MADKPEVKPEKPIDKVDWKKEYDNKQAECVKYIEALEDLRNDNRIEKIKSKVDELFTLIRDMSL